MEKEKIVMIPFVAHESAMNRMERANKRLWLVIIIMIICILLPTEIEETNTQDVSEITDSEVHQTIGE